MRYWLLTFTQTYGRRYCTSASNYIWRETAFSGVDIMTTLNLPTKMEFTMGSTEQKMDMTLDDIIKLGRKSNPKKRVPIKSQNRPRNANGNNPAAKAALQRSVAARSAKIRQGKFAEARARNGAGNFPATQAAGKKAVVAPIRTRNRQWMSDGRRNSLHRAGQGSSAFTAAAGNMKISVINNKSKFSGHRQSRRRNGPSNSVRQVQSVNYRSQNMEIDANGQQLQSQGQRPRTLDALFAVIKERRNQQPQIVQPFSSSDRSNNRRGGRVYEDGFIAYDDR
ncbi:hypothetical protein R1flu_005173 [Riccia fluitans]|uniref:Uncharacterized protein n=1 Tax=Riccia fluitans TaxID=41844 RepID=A0ABD1YSE4_9MARC